jgi:enoyl-CoA hydratase/carnithine racemase
VSGAEAAELGLVNHAVGPDEVLPKAMELAREVASAAPLAVRWTKQSIYRHADWDPVSAARFVAHVQSRSFETEDHREGVKALLEKREPRFSGK